MQKTKITIEAIIQAPVAKVWDYYNEPGHIIRWNFAHESWQCPRAENDLRVGGKLKSRMEARDGSFGFDFEAIYDEIIHQKRIVYTITDGRKVETDFTDLHGKTRIVTTFEAESENPVEMQRGGWQAILDNFKKYAEHMSLYNLSYLEVLEQEVVLTRIVNAPKETVFTAFTTREALDQWFGPMGFASQTFEFDFRIGGHWRFEFKGPDGTIYPNRIEYIEIRPFDRITFFHGEDKDNDPDKFLVTITFDEQQNKKTAVSLRQLHPNSKRRSIVIGFGAIELGMQTMDKLVAYLTERQS